MKQVGRPSGFYGKMLCEIVRNLKNFGVGRYVLRQSECEFPEPCYYKLKRVEPYMPDMTYVRMRAWGDRIYRGRKEYDIRIDNVHQPDWKLVLKHEEEQLLSRELVSPRNKVVDPLFNYPPLLAMYVKKNGYEELNGEPLLCIKPFTYPDEFIELKSVDENVKDRVWPPLNFVRSDGESFTKRFQGNKYYIRRSDTPALVWKVELSQNVTHEKNTNN